MKKLRDLLSSLLAFLLVLGFLACLAAALCDRKGVRIGQMHLQVPR